MSGAERMEARASLVDEGDMLADALARVYCWSIVDAHDLWPDSADSGGAAV